MQQNKKAGSTLQAKQQEDLGKILDESLQDIYWAEKQLTKALPKMAEAASDEALTRAFETHSEQTAEQVAVVEQVFQLLGKPVKAKKCDAMEGLLKEGEAMIADHEPGAARDAGLIMSAQKIEHYEIASYGSMVSFALSLGLDDAADLLTQVLNQEKEADLKLSSISNEVNGRASMFANADQ